MQATIISCHLPKVLQRTLEGIVCIVLPYKTLGEALRLRAHACYLVTGWYIFRVEID